jgi:hypothetical protein
MRPPLIHDEAKIFDGAVGSAGPVKIWLEVRPLRRRGSVSALRQARKSSARFNQVQ